MCFLIYDVYYFIYRDNGSVAITFIDNRERSVTGKTGIAARSSSIRPDLVLYKNGIEYGVAECGKGDDKEATGKKEIVETSLHCPKIMKSMFLHTASKCDNDKDVTRALRIIGFTHFGKLSGYLIYIISLLLIKFSFFFVFENRSSNESFSNG